MLQYLGHDQEENEPNMAINRAIQERFRENLDLLKLKTFTGKMTTVSYFSILIWTYLSCLLVFPCEYLFLLSFWIQSFYHYLRLVMSFVREPRCSVLVRLSHISIYINLINSRSSSSSKWYDNWENMITLLFSRWSVTSWRPDDWWLLQNSQIFQNRWFSHNIVVGQFWQHDSYMLACSCELDC